MAHRNRRALAVFVACAAVGSGVAGATDVRAKVTFDKSGPEFSRIRLTITRNTTTWRSGPLGRAFFRPPKVFVRDLDADRELEVWVDTYTGGAHCCDQSRFFRYVPARQTYVGTFHDWGNVGYRAKNLDGRGGAELVSADDRFAYAFTSFAGSAFPIQIWEFDSGRLRDVTRLFPGQVELDAKRLWRWYLDSRRTGDVRGILAAWVADQYVLGRGAEGLRALKKAAKRGDLEGTNGVWPTGSRYVRALRAFLVKLGYA